MPQLHSESLNLYFLFYKVRRKLSEVTAGYWTDLEIYSALNQGQKKVAGRTKCLKKTETITTTSGTQEYDLRSTTNGFTDLIDIAEDGVYFYANGSAYQPLDYITKKRLNQEYPGWQGVSSSVPRMYYFDKAIKTIGLYPKPNSSNAGAYLFITGYHYPKILHAGTASSGSTTTIVLPAGSSTAPYPNPSNDYYNDLYIEIYSGTGAGQKSEITDYAASTRTCTVSFSTAPDSTSVYGMIPEIPERMQNLMFLYAMAECLEKGGSRTVLSNRYWNQFYSELALETDDFNTDDDEIIVKEGYRSG